MGRRVQSQSFLLVTTPQSVLYVSVVVSKKVAKTAVVRNKVRRRIYDIVRAYRKAHGVTGVYIFIVKNGAPTLPYEVLREEVLSVLKKVHKV